MVESANFTLPTTDGISLYVYHWPLPQGQIPKAVIQIAHGMAEHAARYQRFAQVLVNAGYAVVANDHRGHGRSAQHQSDLGFFADHNGWERLVDDMELVNQHIHTIYPDCPVILLGHSMGSFATQCYLAKYGNHVAAAVLSATSDAPPRALLAAGRIVAKLERLRVGKRGRSKLLQKLSFGTYNKRIPHPNTEFDWLSKDLEEVKAYVYDPLCGFPICVQAWLDLFAGFAWMADPKARASIRKDLPMYIFAGDQDPVSNYLQGIHQLLADYRNVGLTNVDYKFYPSGRHEMLNEVERDEVMNSVVQWLDTTLLKISK